jgi:hypothetical protein
VVAAASRDATIDNGWTELKAASGSKADVETILKEIQKLFWKGVKREIASIIVALDEFGEYKPDALPVETPAKEQLLSGGKLKALLDLWNPFDGGQWPKENTSEKPGLDDIQKTIEEGVTSFFEKEHIQKRRARALLQALGLLDIDFVREHRQPSFRSWGQRPQVDNYHKSLLIARQCSACRHCIRSFHFYECVKGCEDSAFQTNMTKMKPIGKEGGEDSLNGGNWENFLHETALRGLLTEKPRFRVCPTCVVFSSHPREHLRAVRGFSKAGDREVMEFSRELDIWEDHLVGGSLRFKDPLLTGDQLHRMDDHCSLWEPLSLIN